MTGLEEVVDVIGRLADTENVDGWRVCEAISDAFDEFPQYTPGLLAGLQSRLQLSADSIYSRRDAWRLRERVLHITDLRFSFFARLSRLSRTRHIDDEECGEYLRMAAEERWSVEDMCRFVEQNTTEDAVLAYRKRACKLVKSLTVLLEDGESCGLPENIRGPLKTLLGLLSEWCIIKDKENNKWKT